MPATFLTVPLGTREGAGRNLPEPLVACYSPWRSLYRWSAKGEQRVDFVRRTIEPALEKVENVRTPLRSRTRISLPRLRWI